jgi:hypothetical protein
MNPIIKYITHGITVTISEDYKGWWWHLPADDKHESVTFGPFKIEALAQKHCEFYVATLLGWLVEPPNS